MATDQFGGILVEQPKQPAQAAPDNRLLSVFGVPQDTPPDGLPDLPSNPNRDEKFLSSLQPGIAAYVKAVSDGRAKVPEGFIMKTPFGQNLLKAIGQYDPSFDFANAGSRLAMRKNATSGDLGKNITSLNTVMGHLKNLYDSIDALHNTNSPVTNSYINPLSEEREGTYMGGLGAILSQIPGVGHDTDYQNALKNFQSARTAAAKELTRAFRGAAGAEADVQGYEKLFGENDAPEALKAAVKNQINLLASRLHSAANQYNQGMKTTAQPFQFLTPENQKIFKEFVAQEQKKPAAAASNYSDEDLEFTAKKYGISVDEVKKRLNNAR